MKRETRDRLIQAFREHPHLGHVMAGRFQPRPVSIRKVGRTPTTAKMLRTG